MQAMNPITPTVRKTKRVNFNSLGVRKNWELPSLSRDEKTKTRQTIGQFRTKNVHGVLCYLQEITSSEEFNVWLSSFKKCRSISYGGF